MQRNSKVLFLIVIVKYVFSAIYQCPSVFLPTTPPMSSLNPSVFCMKDTTKFHLQWDKNIIEKFADPLTLQATGETTIVESMTVMTPVYCLSGDRIAYVDDFGNVGEGTFDFGGRYNVIQLGALFQCMSSNKEFIPNSNDFMFFNCFDGSNSLNFYYFDMATNPNPAVYISLDLTLHGTVINNFIQCHESKLIDGVACIYGMNSEVYVHMLSSLGPTKQITLPGITAFTEGRIVQIDSSLFVFYYDTNVNGLQLYHGVISLDTPSITSSSIITIGALTQLLNSDLPQCVKKENRLWIKTIDLSLIFGCLNTNTFSIFVINKTSLLIQKLSLIGIPVDDYQFLYYDTLSSRRMMLAWITSTSSFVSLYQMDIPYCVDTPYITVKGNTVPFTISSVFPVDKNNVLEFKLKDALVLGALVVQPLSTPLIVNQYYPISTQNEDVLYTAQLVGSESLILTGLSLEKMEVSCSLSIMICPLYTVPQVNVCINCKDTGRYYYNNQCLNNKPPNSFTIDSNTNAIDYCYPLCATCTLKGTVGNHQCNSCVNGYVLDGSNTQCISSSSTCTEYYFYDSNGVKQCTNTCTVLPYVYILYSCKQCLDKCNSPEACKGSNSLMYSYSNYCLDKCPMGTTNNNLTLQCDPMVNEDYLIYSPEDLLDWIQSVTKEELLEFAKNDSIIINGNYVIDIYNTTNGHGNSSSTDISDSMNISKITLPECTRRLKEHYHIPESDPLIILKIDIDNDKLVTNQVEYEIYSLSGVKLNLSLCANTTVTIESGIKKDDRINWELALNMSLKGIDIFNTSDKFYNDFCFPYTTQSSTDILVEDRRTDIFPNISLCQANCTYKSINYTAMTVECDCDVAPKVDPEPKEPSLKEKFIDSFVSSNIKVVTCYELVFDFHNLLHNVAFWLYVALILIQLLMVLLYALNDYSSLKKDVNGRRMIKRDSLAPSSQQALPRSIPPASPIKKAKENQNAILNSKTRNSIETTNFDVVSAGKFIQLQTKSVATTENDEVSPKKLTLRNCVPSFYPLNKANLINSPEREKKGEINNQVTTLNTSNFSKQRKRRLTNKFGSIIVQAIPNEGEDNITKLTSGDKENENPIVTYEDSLKNDNRPCHQMFWDIFIEKDIIFNTFFELERYQRISIKIINCIFSIALDFSFNALFYTVDIIANSYENEGVIDVLFSFPKSIYSALASILLMWIMSCFSATNYTFKSFQLKRKLVKKFFSCVLIKHIVFFTLNFLFMIFFLYFSVAFCCVYYNSQISWLIDSCISTIMGIAIAIFVSLTITLLRLISLKCKRRCLFETCKLWQSL